MQYKVGDTIYFPTEVFLFAGITQKGDTLMLEKLGAQKINYGVSVGNYAFNLQARDIMKGNTYTIGKSSKYTLLDFWGTWCGPCRAVTPDIKKLQENADNKNLEIVSIAFDDKIEKVVNYLKDEDINWTNLFDSRENSIIASKFKVNAFPTYILIDEKGKIVFRGSGGKDVLKKMEQLLPK